MHGIGRALVDGSKDEFRMCRSLGVVTILIGGASGLASPVTGLCGWRNRPFDGSPEPNGRTASRA